MLVLVVSAAIACWWILEILEVFADQQIESGRFERKKSKVDGVRDSWCEPEILTCQRFGRLHGTV